jgi:hypothetical protein
MLRGRTGYVVEEPNLKDGGLGTECNLSGQSVINAHFGPNRKFRADSDEGDQDSELIVISVPGLV